MIDCVDEEGETEDVGEEDEFLCGLSRLDQLGIMCGVLGPGLWGKTYMSHITADLANLD